LERVVAQSHVIQKETEDSLANGDWLEFEAETDRDFERKEREWHPLRESHWV
jgi:hypothetical protein